MAKKDKFAEEIPEFTLEDIMKEFGSGDLDLDAPMASLGDTLVFPPVTQADLEAVRTAEIPAEAIPEVEEVPAVEESPVEEEAPIEEEAPAVEEVSSEEEVPTEEEAPAEEEIPVEDAPIEEESPAEEEAPTEEEIPAEEEVPSEEEIPTEEEVPTEEESSVEEEVPVEEEAPTEEEAPSEEEIPAGEEVPAEEEIPAEEEGLPAEAVETSAEEETSEEEAAPTEEEPAAEEGETPVDSMLADTQVFTPVTVEDLISEEEAPAEEEETPSEESDTQETSDEDAAEPEEPEAAPAEEEPVVLTTQPIPTPKPILFRSKLGELKRQLVAGPEKRYYDLSEIGLGRIQIAIFLSLVVVLLCAGSTALYAMGAVMENRLRLMIFSQILAMMLSALLGCYLLMDGIMDLFTGKFSLNSMIFLTLAACAADALFCLRELRVPCCAAFSLEMTFALWNRSMRRNTEMGQMDTLRKAVRLDSLVKMKNYFGDEDGILRTEGKLEDFMDNYSKPTGPEKVLNIYALVAVLLCAGIAVLAAVRHGLSLAVQVFSTSMLVALPAGAFVSQSRPAAILERRLHMVGTVICGWQGVKTLCGKASFPLTDRDLFPLGSVKLNGVKFLGDMEPDAVISAAAALMKANGGSLEPVLTQLLKSRNGLVCIPDNVQVLPAGVSGIVRDRSCLLGLKECLEEQGIEIPENALVPQAIYLAADGQLQAVFAMNYARTKASAGGLVTLSGCRKIRPMVLAKNFMVNAELIREKFGIRTKRYDFPDRELRADLAGFQPEEALTGAALTTQQNLSSAAYAVSGASTLRTASRLGMWLHLIAGVLGLLIMATLAYLGDMQLLSPFNILLYQLVWLIPGLLLTEWTRTV